MAAVRPVAIQIAARQIEVEPRAATNTPCRDEYLISLVLRSQHAISAGGDEGGDVDGSGDHQPAGVQVSCSRAPYGYSLLQL